MSGPARRLQVGMAAVVVAEAVTKRLFSRSRRKNFRRRSLLADPRRREEVAAEAEVEVEEVEEAVMAA